VKLCRVALYCLGAFLLFTGFAHATSATRHVDVLRLSGDIDPIHAQYVHRGLQQCENDGAVACIIELDTPGGDLESMKQMVTYMDACTVPTIVYVYPDGGWAGSAGTFITMAADLAVMAPGTAIGAASPVGANGGNLSSTENRKVKNFAIAYIAAQARDHGHNATFAAEAVQSAKAIPYNQAVAEGVVNFSATNITNLLNEADDRTVKTSNGVVTFHTAGASVSYIDMDFSEQLQEVLTDPNLLLILLSVGTLALIFELSSPGAILPGIVGVIFISIALFSLGTLTVNLTGLILMAFALLLFIADIRTPTHGFLTVGGIISFILGAILLFSPSGANGGPTLSPFVVVAVAIGLGLFFGFIVGKAVQARHWNVKTGVQALIGKTAVVRERLDPEGMVYLDGSLWRAVSAQSPVEVGSEVVVTRVEGLTAYVKPVAVGTSNPQSPIKMAAEGGPA
jgi:membrane-bound serine protease (ClpP class)